MTTFNFRRGDTLQKTFQWLQSDETTPVNLTGYTEVLTVVIDDVEYEYTSGDGLTVTPLTGIIAWTAPASDTEDWLTDGRWDLVVISGAGVVTTLDHGRLKRA